jgi:hypothetical protein
VECGYDFGDDFGKESQYSNKQDFTVRKVKYTICPGRLQRLRIGAYKSYKLGK